MLGLKRGSKGLPIKRLQYLLNYHGRPIYPKTQRLWEKLNPDSDFGRLTEAALRAFQKTNGLVPSGAVDEATRAELCNFRKVRIGFYATRGQPLIAARSSAQAFMPASFRLPPLQITPGLADGPIAFKLESGMSQILPRHGPVQTDWTTYSLVLEGNLLLRSHPELKLTGGLQIGRVGQASDMKWQAAASAEYSVEKLVTIGDQLSLSWFAKVEAASEQTTLGELKFSFGPKVTWDILKDRLSLESSFGPVFSYSPKENKVESGLEWAPVLSGVAVGARF